MKADTVENSDILKTTIQITPPPLYKRTVK